MIPQSESPWTLGSRPREHSALRVLGRDGPDILIELGLDDQEIESLLKDGRDLHLGQAGFELDATTDEEVLWAWHCC